jgi:tRNA pseudouridine38-40 synthase
MNNYQLTISYCGTDFYGWQAQDQQNLPTIQGTLSAAFEKVYNLQVEKIIGSGRTDRGVHAINQYVSVVLSREIPAESLARALNSVLPPSIWVKKAIKTKEFIHPLADIISKHYVYLISKNDVRPFFHDRILHITDNCDFDRMSKAAKIFKGTYDFSDFKCQGTETTTSIRTIQECRYVPLSEFELCDQLAINHSGVWALSIMANGFLKQMVRMIVGALLSVGRGTLHEDELIKALANGPTGKRFGRVAEPQGLYLLNSEYSRSRDQIN